MGASKIPGMFVPEAAKHSDELNPKVRAILISLPKLLIDCPSQCSSMRLDDG
jgi:hypothetical protein